MNDKDKVTKASVTARLKQVTDAEEKSLLKQLSGLFDDEAKAKKTLKDSQETLDKAVLAQYAGLLEADIKQLVIQDKWLSTLESNIIAEIERVTQQLANRVKELEERYAEPLPQIEDKVNALSAKVAEHLKAMGLEV
jgi:type I restriction enzyme M protein